MPRAIPAFPRAPISTDELVPTNLPGLYAGLKPVPLLIGTNRDEFSFFSELPIFGVPGERDDLEKGVAEMAGEERGRRIASLYAHSRDGKIALGTDLLFRMAAIHAADTHSASAPTFMYRLDWEAKGLLSRLGATHSVDLPLLFEDFLKPFRSVYLGLLPDVRRHQLAERMRDHWMAFVRDGRPADGWPAYETSRRETLVFAGRDRLVPDPEGSRRQAWEGVDAFAH